MASRSGKVRSPPERLSGFPFGLIAGDPNIAQLMLVEIAQHLTLAPPVFHADEGGYPPKRRQYVEPRHERGRALQCFPRLL
jgi:hypothetical protein